MYAVLKTGGKQYRVEAGATLVVEKLDGEPGSAITFDRVLLVGDGEQVTVGTPTVPGASVSATVLGAELGQKIIVFKFKPKVKYRRRTGHRQRLTLIRIDAISADGKRVTAVPPAKADKPASPAKSARASKAAKAVAAAKGEAAGMKTEPAAEEATATAKRRPRRAATTPEVASEAPPAAKPRAPRAATADAAGATSTASKPTRRRAGPKADTAESAEKADGTEPAEQAEKE